ncbi:hypothetical protein [Siminovitchia sp. 179-K 8D1 HS]|uniref:hypothetical protein n=1 Tax=Siminovitchia sp. 179-K 8D1 HS TaxID=3142385 RepID=UPI0039A38884
MESNLYELTVKKDEKAIEKVINLFAPKIKKTFLQNRRPEQGGFRAGAAYQTDPYYKTIWPGRHRRLLGVV